MSADGDQSNPQFWSIYLNVVAATSRSAVCVAAAGVTLCFMQPCFGPG